MYMQSKKEGLADYLRSHKHPGSIIVCENPQFIYMKAAKTAGSSILRHGLEKTSLEIFHKRDHPERFYSWLAEIDDNALENYFVFAFVRNPWDRFVSTASYLGIQFDNFVKNYYQHLEVPQVYTHSLPLNLYTHFEDGIVFVDYIGRMENIQQDFDEICDHLQLARIKLPHRNRSVHSHYSMYLDQAAFKLMNSVYRKDIDYYGYQFEQRPSTIGERLIRTVDKYTSANMVRKRIVRYSSALKKRLYRI